jgi:hypothetical protein
VIAISGRTSRSALMPKPPRPTAQLPHDSRAFRHAPNIAFKTDSRITRVRPRRRNPGRPNSQIYERQVCGTATL